MDIPNKLTYEQNYLYQLGCLTFVEGKRGVFSSEKSPSKSTLSWAPDAIDQHQLAIVLNSHHFPYGYYHWARLTSQVIKSVASSSAYVLHKSELDEGDHLFIIACCVEPGGFGLLIKDILTRFSPAGASIHWFGRKGRLNQIARFDPHSSKINYLQAADFLSGL